MKFGKKIFSFVGAAALLMSAGSGIASAEVLDTGDGEALVNVTCPQATEVTLSVPSAFSVDATSGTGGYSASITDGFVISANMTCNWTPGWLVGAGMTDFEYMGTAPTGTVDSFSNDHLSLNNGELTGYSGPTSLSPAAGAPYVFQNVFPGGWAGIPNFDPLAMTTDVILFEYASPGVSTAAWDGNLTNLPANLAEGTYQADMIVVLYVP